MEEKVIIGQILKAQGIKGEIKVKPICDDPDRFFDLKRVYAEPLSGGESILCRVLNCRIAGGFVYLYLDKIPSRETAEAVSGQYLKIEREEIVLDEGRFLISDVIGCDAVFEDGETLGRIEDILQTYAIDTYVVSTARGKVLFPAVEKAILAYRIEEKKVVLNRKGFDEVACHED